LCKFVVLTHLKDAVAEKYEKNRVFLTIMLTCKHDYFNQFYKAMAKTNQTGVVAVLNKFKTNSNEVIFETENLG